MKLKKFDLKHESCYWWLRSVYDDYNCDFVGYVCSSGDIYYCNRINNFYSVIPTCIVI